MSERMTVIPSSSVALAPLFQPGGVYEGQTAEVQPWLVEQLAGVVGERNKRAPDNGWHDTFSDSETVHVRMLAPSDEPIAPPEDNDATLREVQLGVKLGTDQASPNAQLAIGMQEYLHARERNGRIGFVGSIVMTAAVESFAVAPAAALAAAESGSPQLNPELAALFGVPWFVWLNAGTLPRISRHFKRLQVLNPKTKAHQRELVRPKELGQMVSPAIALHERSGL